MSSKLWDARAGDVSVEEYAAIEAEERLVYEAQKAIRNLLKHKGMKAADLARLLGVSEARVSQMLGGEARNLTLRTLARIFHTLGSRCVLRREDGEVAVLEESVAQNLVGAQGHEAADATGQEAPEPVSRADAQLIRWAREPLIVGELSDLAAFGKSAVWVFGTGVVPANENERIRHGDEGDEQARSWLSAPLPYQNADERLYA